MKGFQLQEFDTIGGMSRTGTHPRVYKTRWGARLALLFSFEWLFAMWRIVPTEEPEVVVDIDEVLSDFETCFKADPLDHRQWPVVPKDPQARTFTGRTIPPRRTNTDRTGRWKCEQCGSINEWHAPTCGCVRNRRRGY